MTLTKDHPIFNERTLCIPMKAHMALHEKLQEWIITGQLGALIVGMAREGKTVALRCLSNQLVDRMGNPVPSIFVSMPKRDTGTIRSACYCIYTEMGLGLPAGNITADRMVYQIRLQLREIAALHKTQRVILFVDEAQRLNSQQMQVFAELLDKSLFDDVHLSVFFIANLLESQALIKDIVSNDKNAHIRKRFFNHSYQYIGIKNKSDVEYALRQYDNLKDPIHNKSYTEYFLPEEFKKGFRLKSITTPLWKTFSKGIKKELALSSWESQYFFATVSLLLTHLLPKYGVSYQLEEQIEEAIQSSGIVPSLEEVLLQ